MAKVMGDSISALDAPAEVVKIMMLITGRLCLSYQNFAEVSALIH